MESTYPAVLQASAASIISKAGLAGDSRPDTKSEVVKTKNEPAAAAATVATTAPIIAIRNLHNPFTIANISTFVNNVRGWWGTAHTTASKFVTNMAVGCVVLFFITAIVIITIKPPFAQHKMPGQHMMEEAPLNPSAVFWCSLFTVFAFVAVQFINNNSAAIAELVKTIFPQ